MKLLLLNWYPTIAHKEDMADIFRMSFFSPLEECGIAEYEEFAYGPWMEKRGEPVDWKIIKRCIEYGPDTVLLYGWWMPDYESESGRACLSTLYLLRSLLNVRIGVLLFDQTRENFKTSDIFVRFCDIAFTHEDKRSFDGYTLFPEKHFITIATFSPRLFHGDSRSRREIPIGFAGGLTGYGNVRANGIAALQAAGINVVSPGGRGAGQKRLTNDEYAGFFKNSKIIINWSQHISGKWKHVKARVFETTLAGAMLLCEECPEVNNFFEPWVDYVPFSNEQELVERARYYLEHEEERLKIAVNGNRKALEKYNAHTVWSGMLDRIKGDSLYKEEEAIEGLKKHANSLHELKVARFMRDKLKKEYPQLDHGKTDYAVAIIEEANRPHLWCLRFERAQWKISYSVWQILTWLKPSFMNNTGLGAAVRRLLRGL